MGVPVLLHLNNNYTNDGSSGTFSATGGTFDNSIVLLGSHSWDGDTGSPRVVGSAAVPIAGDFTVLFAYYKQGSAGTLFNFGDQDINESWHCEVFTSTIYVVMKTGGGGSTDVITATHGLTDNAWNWICVQRQGSTVEIADAPAGGNFTSRGTGTWAPALNGAFALNDQLISGSWASYPLAGHYDEVYIDDAAAKYPTLGGSAAPTAELSAGAVVVAGKGPRIGVRGPKFRKIDGPTWRRMGADAPAGSIDGAGGIASGEAFGQPAVGAQIDASGIASAEAFGSPVVSAQIATTGIASAEAFGTPAVAASISATGVASAEAFGSAVVAAQVDGAGGIASAEAVGSPAVGASIVGTGIASAEAFGSHQVAAQINGTGIASGEAFGSPVVGDQGIVAVGIPSAEAFGSPVVSAQVAATGIASAEALGAPVVSASIVAAGIASAEALGAPAVAASIVGTGIASAEAFGLVTVGNPEIVCIGIPSEEAFGQPVVGSTPDEPVTYSPGAPSKKKRRPDVARGQIFRDRIEPQDRQLFEQAAQEAAAEPEQAPKQEKRRAVSLLKEYGIYQDAYAKALVELAREIRQQQLIAEELEMVRLIARML